MARDFARDFYLSKAWRKVREYIFIRDGGLCVHCDTPTPGEIVHHIIPLSPENIDDPDITLGEDNLELVCRECHAKLHGVKSCTADGLTFDESGNLIKK